MDINGKNMSFEEVCDLFDSSMPVENGDSVVSQTMR